MKSTAWQELINKKNAADISITRCTINAVSQERNQIWVAELCKQIQPQLQVPD
jgi:hypothetical protein